MDLVDYKEEVYDNIVEEFQDFSSKLLVKDVRFIPISALLGDNVVNKSEKMTWYNGAPLLHTLETIHISSDFNSVDARFPVQTVLRPQREGFIDYRGYAGRIASGIFRPGDDVTVLPSGFTSKVKTVEGPRGELGEAYAPMSVSITLEDDIDISRGDMIVRSNNQPTPVQDLEVMLCWMNNSPARPRAKYTIRHTTNEQTAMIKEVLYKIDIQTLGRNMEDKEIGMNDICKVRIRTTKPLMIDSYRENRSTGNLILIDETTNETVAAGMII